MKNKVNKFLVILGIIIFITGFILNFNKAESNLVNIDGIGYIIFSVIPIFLIVFGVLDIFSKKTKEEIIEEKDERNIKINSLSKASGFNFMTIAYAITIITLYSFKYIDFRVFGILALVYSLSQFIYVFKLISYNKSM